MAVATDDRALPKTRRKAGTADGKVLPQCPQLAARQALPRSGAAGILISFTRGQTSMTSFFEATPDPPAKQGTRGRAGASLRAGHPRAFFVTP